MKIYVAHSSSYDYEADIYEPLKKSPLWDKHEFYLPHEPDHVNVGSAQVIKDSGLLIAEVSAPSTGLGIELGLAHSADVPIVGFYREGVRPSSALQFYVRELIAYKDTDDLLQKIGQAIQKS